ncbi:MAG: DUF1810 domain-containing protein [Acidobacteriota bacterium]|jgi:uncharacterized protein (DUF1810 family)|nr:DUF1810 domain-containing protein [Acidobacteriota bacterium]
MSQTSQLESNDHFDLTRFITAQEMVYSRVLFELRNGRKRTHWMWFIFPQIDGLGNSSTTKRYAIKSIEEAQEYLNHPLLGKRLKECAETVLAVEGRSISEIFGYPDDLKLKSSTTLFENVADSDPIYASMLNKYFNGERDIRTLNLLEKV